MELEHWLYVSRIRIEPAERPAELESIVEASKIRNRNARLSGCLVMTDSHFAQCIEGPRDGMHQIRESIIQDPRHQHIQTVGRGPVAERQFASWSLGYVGPSPLISRLIMQRVRDAGLNRPGSAERLLAAMRTMQELQGETG